MNRVTFAGVLPSGSISTTGAGAASFGILTCSHKMLCLRKEHPKCCVPGRNRKESCAGVFLRFLTGAALTNPRPSTCGFLGFTQNRTENRGRTTDVVLLRIKCAYSFGNDRGMTLPLSANLTMAVGQLGIVGVVFQGRCPWLW